SGDIILTSEQGQVIRLKAIAIPTLNRDTLGVILMRLKPEDKVSAVSVFEKEEDNNGAIPD
ncbi:hypothetical protein CO178_00160, partial [candidate division WWE3 bacterium CG_4_9_14_3_um_filter_34_6]